MTEEEFKALKEGDIVRHKSHSESYVVSANYGRYVIAVRTAHVTNPREWDRIDTNHYLIDEEVKK